MRDEPTRRRRRRRWSGESKIFAWLKGYNALFLRFGVEVQFAVRFNINVTNS